MATISLSHRWRETPLRPASYEDVPACVEVARMARAAIVDFEWTLDRGAVERLREAVHAWGARVQGRYRRFDAQVLAAIADALGEHETVYRLSYPAKGDDGSTSVTAEHSGELCRFSGHATADVLLGYCLGAWKGRVRLGDELVQAFEAAGRELGWDAAVLQQDRMRAVMNTLYGLPLTNGMEGATELGPVEGSLPVHFEGPFSALPAPGRRCLFDAPVQSRAGVYIWTVLVGDAHHAMYVGQTTRSFGPRMLEHFQSYLSGKYAVLDAERLPHGERRVVWPGQNGGSDFAEFVGRLETLVPLIRRQIDALHVHVAPLVPEGRLFDRVEGAVGRHLRDHQDPTVRRMFNSQVQFPASIPGETRTTLLLTSDTPIVGLPGELVA